MNQDIKASWIAALRSGKYAQGTGALCRNVGDARQYCCLGVLTDLAVQAGIVEPFAPAEEDDCFEFGSEHNDAFLSTEVLEWAEIEFYNPKLIFIDGDDEVFEEASEANDNTQRTFTEIADAIERTL